MANGREARSTSLKYDDVQRLRILPQYAAIILHCREAA
jgi:hypothetical protein